MLAAATVGFQLATSLAIADAPGEPVFDSLDSGSGSGISTQSANPPNPAPHSWARHSEADYADAGGLRPAALLRVRPTVPRFLHITSGITVDGRLDESAWREAAPTTRFYEIYPGNLAPPKVRTEARFLYDQDYVYVGIRADDAHPDRLRSHFTRRDQLTTAWYSSITYRTYSHDFRSWNGFLSRVGASSATLSSGLYFYPKNALVTRVSPLIAVSSTSEAGGKTISRSLSPGFSIQGPLDTYVTLSWSPAYHDTTAVGLRSANSWSASIMSTPVDWMPNTTLSFSGGDTLDYSTGAVGRGRTLQAILPLRLDRLELDATLAYQSLDANRDNVAPRRLFTERNVQLNAIWHFSSRLYAQALYQNARLTTADQQGDSPLVSNSGLSSFLVSYQANWQTRYFVGVRDSSQGREVFGKIAYAFSR